MKRALGAGVAVALVAALYWHELTEAHEIGGADSGDGWRIVAIIAAAVAYLVLTLGIWVAGSIDYGLLGAVLRARRERAGRHRIRYADHPLRTNDLAQAPAPTIVHAHDRGARMIRSTTAPTDVVFDETEVTAGGTR